MRIIQMYSDKFLDVLFRYMKQPPISHARGRMKGQLLFEGLEANNFVNNEATVEHVIAVVSLVERFGGTRAKEIVGAATNPLVFTRGEFSENSGKQPLTKKKETKKKSKKSRKQAEKEISANGIKGPAQITEYYVVSSHGPDQLLVAVNSRVKAGWQPLGGVSVAVRHQPKVEVLFSQAMVYRE